MSRTSSSSSSDRKQKKPLKRYLSLKNMTNDSTVNRACLWRSAATLTVGEITRFRIRFDPDKLSASAGYCPSSLTLEVANTTSMLYRGLLLNGPFLISACCVDTSQFTLKAQAVPSLPQIKPALFCGDKWRTTLDVPIEREGDWTIEVRSEVVFASVKVRYEIALYALIPEGEYSSVLDDRTWGEDGRATCFTPSITYELRTSQDIFGLPDLIAIESRDVHFVVLTHGLNGSALDELYLKEQLEECYESHESTRVVAYISNVNHALTYDGIEKCAKRLAEKILNYAGWPWTGEDANQNQPSGGPRFAKISMVGHSLGGLINVCLAGYLNSVTDGEFYKSIEPIHFITIATPWLGSTDQSWYVRIAMVLGGMGQTGKDLVLMNRSRLEQAQATGASEQRTFQEEPLLLALARPSSPSHKALALFKGRTVYANIANDVSVSFTSSCINFVRDPEHWQPQGVTLIDQLQHVHNALNPRPPSTKRFEKCREVSSPIKHDELYVPESVPPYSSDKNIKIEERIARYWHEDLSWRKVYVHLEGEAHLGVVVRRRWINHEGERVIEHLLENHKF